MYNRGMSNAPSKAMITEGNLSSYSDLLKDLNGFRPDADECEAFRAMSLSAQDELIRMVAEELAREIARDRNG